MKKRRCEINVDQINSGEKGEEKLQKISSEMKMKLLLTQGRIDRWTEDMKKKPVNSHDQENKTKQKQKC